MNPNGVATRKGTMQILSSASAREYGAPRKCAKTTSTTGNCGGRSTCGKRLGNRVRNGPPPRPKSLCDHPPAECRVLIGPTSSGDRRWLRIPAGPTSPRAHSLPQAHAASRRGTEELGRSPRDRRTHSATPKVPVASPRAHAASSGPPPPSKAPPRAPRTKLPTRLFLPIFPPTHLMKHPRWQGITLPSSLTLTMDLRKRRTSQ